MGHRDNALRVLVANETDDVLDALCRLADELGHHVVERTTRLERLAELHSVPAYDVAVVGLAKHGNQRHALGLVRALAEPNLCPVVLVTTDDDPGLIARAAEDGAYACLPRAEAKDLGCALAVALRRFADQRKFQDAAARRVVIEQAKGIIMERYGLDETSAFERLRRSARGSNRKVVDAARTVIEGHRLLPP
jgi:AmiR/NasT family two-component response regulator